MSARPRVSPAPRLALLLANEQQPEEATVLYPDIGLVTYPSLDLALDALRSEVPT